MAASIEALGTAPSPDAIHEFFQNVLRLQSRVVGQTFEGRDMILYDTMPSGDEPAVLFISLVHGNEPMGLLTHLHLALSLTETTVSLRGSSAMRFLFLPIVNVDAYTINSKLSKNCRRTNLRSDCGARLSENDCPVEFYQDGVDLNRNFPSDWNGMYSNPSKSKCSSTYPGTRPFSEPETRSIRDVVLQTNVIAAMSFHSMSSSRRPSMLIHPYASSRPVTEMNSEQLDRYRSWGSALNENKHYRVGTAQESIGYIAGGTTIDWMHSHGVACFVMEVSPPCQDKFCPSVPLSLLQNHSSTAQQFVELVTREKHLLVSQRERMSRTSSNPLLPCALTITFVFVLWKRRHTVSWLLQRLRGKQKDVADLSHTGS